MAFGRRCVWTGARAPCEHSQRRSATSWHAPPACNRHAVWLPPPTMAAQRRRARGLDTCRRASPPPSRTTSVRSWTYAASAAFEARTCSTCSAVARKRRRIGSARRDAIPGMPSRARTSGWRTVAHGALLRRPAPLKSRSASRRNFAESYQKLDAARKALGDADRALEAYHTASHLAPLGNEARRGAALVPRERGGLGEALHWLRSARALSPSEAQIALDVGIVHVSAPDGL